MLTALFTVWPGVWTWGAAADGGVAAPFAVLAAGLADTLLAGRGLVLSAGPATALLVLASLALPATED